MSEKSNFYSQLADQCIGYESPEKPEVQQAYMLKAIGFALLAIFEVLQEKINGNNSK